MWAKFQTSEKPKKLREIWWPVCGRPRGRCCIQETPQIIWESWHIWSIIVGHKFQIFGWCHYYCAFHMRIVKFKSQLTIAFFAAVNHLNGPLRKQNFTLTGSKVMVCDLWLVDFDPFCVSVLQGSLLVIVIMIDGSKKRNCEGGLWTLEFAWLRKAQ